MKFNKYYVTNGTIKAKVFYSIDNRTDNRNCVTLYAKDYSRNLGELFTEYKNDTDSQTDYFDQGHVTLFEDHPLYKAARDRATFKPEPKQLNLESNFDAALTQFITACQTKIDIHYLDHPSSPQLSTTQGRKYIRVVKKDYEDQGGSVYGFVDIETGTVLKANGWKTPNPKPYGNIYDDDHGAKFANEYSIK